MSRKKPSRILITNPRACIGCRTCELFCSFYHFKEQNPARALLHVVKDETSGIDYPSYMQALRQTKMYGRMPGSGGTVTVSGHPLTIIGVFVKQGEFLGLFSFDNQLVMPLNAFRKMFSIRGRTDLRVKVTDKTQLQAAKEELDGAMRRVRGQLPGERDNFSINEQQAFKAQLDPVKQGIALAGLFITGLSLFVGAIGIMNITFVSVKERTKEIGTRKALGARRRTILLQFLVEAVSICLIGGAVGMGVAYAVFLGIQLQWPSFPVEFSPDLVVLSMLVSVATGVISGFAPAWGASRLDPVVALRYE